MDERTTLATLAGAAGLPLSPARIEVLLPGFRRINATAAWLRAADLGFAEPALVFDER